MSSCLIGLDWGTSQLRAYRFGEDGSILDKRTSPHGIRHLPAGGFVEAFGQATSGWDDAPVLACGMVGSRNGWLEVPYLDTPADVHQLAGALTVLEGPRGTTIHIVPGLREPKRPDVMRGEETQVLGVLSQFPELATRGSLLLPGTHSKWVSLRDGGVATFATVMTGEMFGLLRDHSILGTNLPTATDHPEAFALGVRMARDSGEAGALSTLFSARALMLDGALPGDAVHDYLSGLLIGDELRIALAAGWAEAGASVLMVGEGPLCERYLAAARLFGIDLRSAPDSTTAQGLWRIALAAGLVTSHATA